MRAQIQLFIKFVQHVYRKQAIPQQQQILAARASRQNRAKIERTGASDIGSIDNNVRLRNITV